MIFSLNSSKDRKASVLIFNISLHPAHASLKDLKLCIKILLSHFFLSNLSTAIYVTFPFYFVILNLPGQNCDFLQLLKLEIFKTKAAGRNVKLN